MSRRIDYLDDPDAPEANSLVPSVNVGIVNDDGGVLLIRRTDNENWALPGGAMDIGETSAEAAVRETREETGIECEIIRLVGVYTNPRHVMLYTSNGEVRQECSLVFAARATGGELTTSSESSEVRCVAPVDLDQYPMHPSMRQRVEHMLRAARRAVHRIVTRRWWSSSRGQQTSPADALGRSGLVGCTPMGWPCVLTTSLAC